VGVVGDHIKFARCGGEGGGGDQGAERGLGGEGGGNGGDAGFGRGDGGGVNRAHAVGDFDGDGGGGREVIAGGEGELEFQIDGFTGGEDLAAEGFGVGVGGEFGRAGGVEAVDHEFFPRACVGIEADDAVVVGVGDEEIVRAADGDGRGLKELHGRAGHARAGLAGAREGFGSFSGGVDDFDFVVVGIGDKKFGSVGRERNAQGVLEAGGSGIAVDVAEVKEAVADDGEDAVFLDVQAADGGDFGVGEIEDVIFRVKGEAGGLGEVGVGSDVVADVFAGGAGGDFGGVGHEVHLENLVLPGLRDVEAVADDGDIPGGVKALLAAGFAGFGIELLLAGAQDGGDGFFLEVGAADEVVLGVGDPEGGAGNGGALGAVEGGVREVAIGGAGLAAADDLLDGDVAIVRGVCSNDDAVMIGVDDQQAFVGGVGDDFAGEGEAGGGADLALVGEFQGGLGKRALGAAIGEGAGVGVLEVDM